MKVTREEVYAYLDKMIEAKKAFDETTLSYGNRETAHAYDTGSDEIFIHGLRELMECIGQDTYRRTWGIHNQYYVQCFDYKGYTFADIDGDVEKETA